jgi:DNA (cytosine-5)-methyltransferase 1
VFVVASLLPLGSSGDWTPDEHRLKQVARFVEQHPGLNLQAARLPALPDHHDTLTNVVESLPPNDQRWWDAQRRSAFLGSLSGIQDDRLQLLRQSERVRHAAAYRRTRHGKAVWEIRSDEISGCLRTARGGSSRQALVEAGRGEVRVRWMTAREYARLQGAPSFEFGDASENQAKFAMGDAVCVPAVAWLARNYLVPLAQGSLSSNPRRQTLAHA